MDGDIGAAIEDRTLHFAREDADASHLRQRLCSIDITCRRDLDELDPDLRRGGTQQRRHVLCLPHREIAGASGDADEGGEGSVAHKGA